VNGIITLFFPGKSNPSPALPPVFFPLGLPAQPVLALLFYLDGKAIS
jgi:hypothetical protein